MFPLQESQKEWGDIFLIKLSKVKDEERILKAAREKRLIMYKGTSISEFLHRNLASQEGVV